MLRESDNLDILGVTFDSKMTFEKHLPSPSRAVSQRFGILKSWQVFHDRSLLGISFRGFVLPFFSSTVLQCGARLPIQMLNYRTV